MRLPLRFHPLLRALTLSFLLASAIFASTQAQQAPQKPPEKPSAKASTPTEKAENPAQIELLETRYRFEANGDSRKEVHARVHINSELGVRQFARLNFDYNRSFENVEIPLVRITHPSGGTADILPSAITDQPNPAVVNAPAYQDVRVKSVRILGLAPGDDLEYRVITTVAHHPLAPDFWLDHSFDRTGVVTQEIFELDLPGHLNSTATMGNWHGGPALVVYLTVQETSYRYDPSQGSSGRSIYRWEILSTRRLPAPIDDDGAPAPDVLVSSFPDWHELVTRLAPHFFNWPEDDRKEAEARLHSFAPKAGTPDKKLRAGYEFVSQKLATVDLPVGATGFHLRHVKEILDSGYATSEEKCSLLAQFASVAGIKAEIVFVGAPETQKQFARPSPFNHVFVIVPEKKKHIALDPSLEVAPFGLIAPQFRGKTALSLTLYDGGDYMSVNWSSLLAELPFSPSQRVSIDATLSAGGTLSSKVHYTLRGDNELLLRVAFHQAPKEKWKDLAQLLSLSDGFRGQVTSVNASDPYATHEPFTVDYEIAQPKFVDWSKKPVRILALLPQLGLPDPPAKPTAGAAPSPIELGTPLEVETQMTLHLPPGTTPRTPTGTSVQRDYATFASQYSAKGLTVTASRHIHFLLRQVPAESAADYNAFLRAVLNDEAQDFTLDRPGAPALDVKPAAPTAAAPQPTPKP
ncbi:MAG TPA: DUF3857 domain-containing protein [Candidatus Acidoferrum sp.]|nr:DUF3857 domain-containing protein [Candidatus Acidoferrum sp.]